MNFFGVHVYCICAFGGLCVTELFCEFTPTEVEAEVCPAAEDAAALSVSAFAAVSDSPSAFASLVTR